MAADRTVRASAYVVVEAVFRTDGTVREAKVVSTRQTRPRVQPNQMAVLVHLDMPASIFERITPTAVIEIPEDFVLRPEVVTVTAGELDGDD